MKPAEEILTERLRMRPPQLSDAEAIFSRYGQDAEVCKFMLWKPHKSVDDSREFLKRTLAIDPKSPVFTYLIFARDSGQLLGSIGGAVTGPRMQFGYCLARDAWGRGYATEATRAFVNWAMSWPEIWRIQAFCDLENHVSVHVLEKCGFTREGTLRRYMSLPNLSDTPRDLYCFAKVRE